jgi:hypothetical protein
MSVEDETFKVFFAFFGLARRASLDPPPSPLTLWLFFIDHPAPKARNTQSKLHATQKTHTQSPRLRRPFTYLGSITVA